MQTIVRFFQEVLKGITNRLEILLVLITRIGVLSVSTLALALTLRYVTNNGWVPLGFLILYTIAYVYVILVTLPVKIAQLLAAFDAVVDIAEPETEVTITRADGTTEKHVTEWRNIEEFASVKILIRRLIDIYIIATVSLIFFSYFPVPDMKTVAVLMFLLGITTYLNSRLGSDASTYWLKPLIGLAFWCLVFYVIGCYVYTYAPEPEVAEAYWYSIKPWYTMWWYILVHFWVALLGYKIASLIFNPSDKDKAKKASKTQMITAALVGAIATFELFASPALWTAEQIWPPEEAGLRAIERSSGEVGELVASELNSQVFQPTLREFGAPQVPTPAGEAKKNTAPATTVTGYNPETFTDRWLGAADKQFDYQQRRREILARARGQVAASPSYSLDVRHMSQRNPWVCTETQVFPNTQIEIPDNTFRVMANRFVDGLNRNCGQEGCRNEPAHIRRLNNLIPNLPYMAVIGKIGENGEPFLIGRGVYYTGRQDGKLCLTLNNKYEGGPEGGSTPTTQFWRSTEGAFEYRIRKIGTTH